MTCRFTWLSTPLQIANELPNSRNYPQRGVRRTQRHHACDHLWNLLWSFVGSRVSVMIVIGNGSAKSRITASSRDLNPLSEKDAGSTSRPRHQLNSTCSSGLHSCSFRV